MVTKVPMCQVPLESKWRRGPIYIYEKNYGYGMNYYQPMIDYIDEKENNIRAKSAYPHLPWSDGRAFWEHKTVRPYSRQDLVKHAINAEAKAREHLENFKVCLTKKEIIKTKKFFNYTRVSD